MDGVSGSWPGFNPGLLVTIPVTMQKTRNSKKKMSCWLDWRNRLNQGGALVQEGLRVVLSDLNGEECLQAADVCTFLAGEKAADANGAVIEADGT